MGGYAWVTLATNDAYSLGALVLAHSLRRVGTKYELACMVTPGVTATMREKLAAVFSLVQEVNVLDSKDEANLALLARPELGITFTKLHCWRLTQYEKCVFVDADTLVIRNCDELFEREELSAAPDVGWPDCFNSGVFVFRPSQQTFASITAFAAAKGSFDGGDQGLLNMYFSDWATKDISKHLPFIYNMCSTATYSYLPAFKQFGEDVRIIHFIGITKPWLQYFDTLTGIVQPPPGSGHLQPLLQLWWNIFCERVHPQLSASMMGIAGALAQLTLGEARSAEQIAFEEHMRKQSWEQGQIDYMGRDSFDNIWKKICETLSLAPQRQPTPPKEDTAKESTAAAEPTVKTAAPVDVEVDKSAVEAPAQSVVCKVPEEKLSTAQTESVTDARIPEQEVAALPSKESITVEAAATKVSSESRQSVATEDVCAKSPIELKDVKLCEMSTEVPPPKPPVESLPTETITEQCKLASLPATQEVMCQDKSETKEPQQADSQAFTTLLAGTVCKKETSTAVSSIPITAKSEVPASAIEAATLPASPISVDSPQTIAASVIQSKAPVEDAAKCVIEPVADVTQPLTIDPSEQRAEMLLAASEVSTMSPVPIQVAESVLQAEPKETVSGAVMVVSDQAITTTVTTVQDSIAAVPTSPIQLNGSACEIEARGAIATDMAVLPDLLQKTDIPVEAAKELAKEALSEAKPVTEEKVESSSSVVLPEISPAKVEELPKSAKSVARTETAEMKPAEQIAKTEAAETKLAEQIVKEEMAKEKPAEQIAKKETTEEKVAKTETTEAIAKQPETVAKARMTETKPAEQVEVEATVAKSPSAVPESPIAEQSLPTEVPIEAKATNIPSMPTVIEATPPTTPSVESVQEAEEKTAKKNLKKSDSPESADGEGADKKGAKKTMKKMTKKPKTKPEEPIPSAATEGDAAAAPADNSQSKTKKTVKVTKKTGLKTGQILETETSVPETPPPPSPASTASPDVPVPPKRKTKNSTSAKGTNGKKPEAEE